MQDPYPLDCFHLKQKDTKESNERESPCAAGDLSMRALVPHGSAVTTGGAESGEPLRSEDDTALMRSLISLMPHERADRQVQGTNHPCHYLVGTAPSSRIFRTHLCWWTSSSHLVHVPHKRPVEDMSIRS